MFGELHLSHSGQALRMLLDGDGCWIFVVGSGRCRQSWEEQAPVLWTALVSPFGTPPMAGGALLVVGTTRLTRQKNSAAGRLTHDPYSKLNFAYSSSFRGHDPRQIWYRDI